MTVQRFGNFNMYCPSKAVLVLTVAGKAKVEKFARISIDGIGIEWYSFSLAGMAFNELASQKSI